MTYEEDSRRSRFTSAANHSSGWWCSWSENTGIVAQSPLPVLLAGGIGPENAAAALAQVHPAGLDSSSRTQSVPGRKDARKVRDLARVVKG